MILEVRDSGIGMSAEVRERAFEPFFTTKGKMGTGLGLAEVYGIVKRHRGQAEIESMPGVGTTIRLVFPRASADRDCEVPEIPTRKRVARRVLLVEDHPDSREFMQALLESDGHQVDTAVGITEAMDAAAERRVQRTRCWSRTSGLSDGSGWDLIDIRARAVAVDANRRRDGLGAARQAQVRTAISFFETRYEHPNCSRRSPAKADREYQIA